MKSSSAACLLLGLVIAITVQQADAQNIGTWQLTGLRTEYLENPIGLDAAAPRFTWRVESSNSGFRQQTVNIMVSSDPAGLKAGRNLQWQAQFPGRSLH
jgi:alpha-L-rhamnosidase